MYHIASAADWEQVESEYAPARFAEEGFIHCSTASQVASVAAARFRGRHDLVLLSIDPERVDVEIRYENLEGGTELFPHIYGSLNLGAVLAAQMLFVSDDGHMEIGGHR